VPADGGEDEPTGHVSLRGAVTTLSVVGIYVALSVALFWNIWSAHPATDTLLGGDTFLNTWFLAWGPHALFSAHNPFYSDYANYPYGVNALPNTSELLLGFISYPVTLLWGPIASFNTVMTLSFPASATAAYFLARRFTAWRPAAFAAGLVYGFSPYMIASGLDDHIHLSFVPIPPLIALVLHELVVRQRGSATRWGIALGVCVVAQFFVSTEVLSTTVVVIGTAVIVTAVIGHRHWRDHVGHALTGFGWALGIALALLAYPVWFLIAGPAHIVGPIELVPEAYRADLLGPIVPDSLLRFAPSGLARIADHFATDSAENGSYLGIPLVAACVATTVWLWHRPVIKVTAITGAVAFVFSLGGALTVSGAPLVSAQNLAVGVFSLPEYVFQKLPLLDNTIAARFSVYVALAAGLMLAFLIDRLHDTRHRPRLDVLHRVGLPALVSACCLVPLVPVAPFASVGPADTPAYFSSPAVDRLAPGSATILLPYPSGEYPETQIWQVTGRDPFRFKMPGAYLFVPQAGAHGALAFSPTYGYTNNTLPARVFLALAAGRPLAATPSLRRALLDQLRSWHVANLVFPEPFSPHPTMTRRYLIWLFGQPDFVYRPQATLVWYHLDSAARGTTRPAKRPAVSRA